MSIGGIFLESEFFIKLGTELLVTFELPDVAAAVVNIDDPFGAELAAALGLSHVGGARAKPATQVRLDDLVDYLNYVIVPAVFMVESGAVPGWGWAALPVLASAYGFRWMNDAT